MFKTFSKMALGFVLSSPFYMLLFLPQLTLSTKAGSSDFLKLKNYLLESLTESADVCQPYEFMCEKLINNSKSDEKNKAHQFYYQKFFDDDTLKHIEDVIKSIDTTDKNVPNYKKSLRNYYDLCQKLDHIDSETNFKQDLKLLDKILGPLKDYRGEIKDDNRLIWKTFGYLTVKTKISSIFDLVIPKDQKNSSRFILEFLPSFFLPSDKSFDTDLEEFITKCFNYLNQTVSKGTIKKLSLNLVKLREDLVNVTKHELTIKPDRIYNADEMKENFPKFSLNQFVEGFLSPDEMKVFNAKEFLFRVRRHDHFEGIIDFVDNHTSPELYNYFVWSAIYGTYKYNLSQHVPCSSFFNMGLGPAMVRSVFDHNKWNISEWIRDLDDISSTLKYTLKSHLNNVTWLTSNQVQSLHDSIDRTELKYSLDHWYNDNDHVEKITPKFDPNVSFSENFLNNYQTELKRKIKWMLFNESIDNYNSDDVHEHDDLPFSKLLPPYFHPQYPISVKYGVIGMKFMQEILRDGALHLIRIRALECYPNRRPIRDTHSSFVNSIEDCYECCDVYPQLYALMTSYLSYKNHTLYKNEKSSIDGLKPYSDDQLFLLVASRHFCENPNDNEKSSFDKILKSFSAYGKIFDKECFETKCSTQDWCDGAKNISIN